MSHDIGMNEATVMSYPAELRGTYIFKKGDFYHYCSEPRPDVATKTVSDISANLKQIIAGKGEIEAGLAAKLSTDVVALAGRTQLVLVARDMLYAICELTLNHDLTKDDFDKVKQMYEEVGRVIGTLAEADKKAAEATASDAEARLLKIRKEVKELIKEQARKINSIISYVTDEKGKLMPDKLRKLVEDTDKSADTKLDDSTKRLMLGAKSADELRDILSTETDWAIDPLFRVLPK